MTDSKVDNILKSVLERAGNELAGVRMKEIAPEQSLFGGPGALLDSLGLVSFIFILEDEIRSATGKTFKVSASDILSKDDAPFRNISSLQSWLSKRI